MAMILCDQYVQVSLIEYDVNLLRELEISNF